MTRRINKILFLGLLLLASPYTIFGDDAQSSPIIDSIDGDQVVVVKTPEGHKIGSPGTSVNFGDRIKTGPRASAKIRFADGSKLIIGRGTEMEVQLPENGVQKNELITGQVRGVIKKAKTMPGISNTSAVPRFVIKTKAAVMGVRGTDFVFSTTDQAVSANLKTLDGVVDVAKDEKVLMEGKGTPVHPNEEISADAQTVSTPKNFNRTEFVKELQAEQPAFVSMGRTDADLKIRSSAVEDLRLPEREKSSKSLLEPWYFGLGPVYVSQKLGGYSYSLAPSWEPVINPLNFIAIQGHFSFYPLKGRTDNDRFVAQEFGAMVYPTLLNPLIIEAGIIGVRWGSKINTEMTPILIAGWKFDESSFFERFFVSYSSFHVHPTEGYYRDNLAKVMRAGFGFRF